MAKRSLEPARHTEAHHESGPRPTPDLVVKEGGKLFKIGLPLPAIHYTIEAPTQSEAIEGYNHLAGVITTTQAHEVIELHPDAEPSKG